MRTPVDTRIHTRTHTHEHTRAGLRTTTTTQFSFKGPNFYVYYCNLARKLCRDTCVIFVISLTNFCCSDFKYRRAPSCVCCILYAVRFGPNIGCVSLNNWVARKLFGANIRNSLSIFRHQRSLPSTNTLHRAMPAFHSFVVLRPGTDPCKAACFG